MTVEFDSVSIEIYDPGNSQWENVNGDVMAEPRPRWNMGIMGNKTLDRVGDPEIFTFSLNNSSTNQNQTEGNYTDGHVNCLELWNVGLKVRVSFNYNSTNYYKYYGWISPDGIVADTGTNGTRTVTVTCVGFMGKAAEHNLDLLAIESNKTIEQAVQSIVANMPISPVATDNGTGANLFPSVFDTVTPGTKALAEMLKLAVSEVGYVYTMGDTTAGQTLVVKGRQDLIDVTSSYTFDNDMMAMDVGYGKALANRIKTNAYPRETDTSYIVMWKLNKAIRVAGNTTIGPFRGTYRNPTGGSKTMKGSDLQTPVATTDYVGHVNEDGSGTDKTADMVVTVTFGATDFEYSIENTSSVALWTGGTAGKFQVRGKGVYFDDQSTNVVDDATSQAAYGMKELTIDMKYQDDPTLVKDYAEYYLDVKKDPYKTIESITLNANRDTNNIEAFLNTEPGSRVTVIEDMSAVNDDFYIMGYDAEIIAMRYVIWKPVLVNTLEIDFDLWLDGYTTKEETFTGLTLDDIFFGIAGYAANGTAIAASLDGRDCWVMQTGEPTGTNPYVIMNNIGTASAYNTGMGRVIFVTDFYPNTIPGTATRMEFGWNDTGNNYIVSMKFTDFDSSADIVGSGLVYLGGTISAQTAGTFTAQAKGDWYRSKIIINQLATKVDYYFYNSSGVELWHDTLTTTLPGTATNLYPWLYCSQNVPPGTATNIVYLDYWTAGYTV